MALESDNPKLGREWHNGIQVRQRLEAVLKPRFQCRQYLRTMTRVSSRV